MLSILVLAALAVCDNVADWNKFKIRFNKRYTAEEENARFDIFVENMALASLMNRLDASATYGVTRFSDLTQEEFAERYLKYTPDEHVGVEESPMLSTVGIPNKLDWSEEGILVQPKDQGNCGSCWSFSCTGALEAAWNIVHGTKVSLSEQQLIDCRSPPNNGCDGGNMISTHPYQISVGQMSEADYPYKAKQSSCKVDTDEIVAKAKDWGIVPKNEDQMRSYMYEKGPLPVGINANPLQLYTGGVFDPSSCSALMLNHAVLAVGYDVSAATPYWKIRNSWGTSWGENGYFRLKYGENTCGVKESVTWLTA